MPLRDLPEIVVGHGGGGAMSGELIEQLFLPAYADAAAAALGDSAVLGIVDARIAFSTDSFVVRPMFPGGSIGGLAINGTVNDLAPGEVLALHWESVCDGWTAARSTGCGASPIGTGTP